MNCVTRLLGYFSSIEGLADYRKAVPRQGLQRPAGAIRPCGAGDRNRRKLSSAGPSGNPAGTADPFRRR